MSSSSPSAEVMRWRYTGVAVLFLIVAMVIALDVWHVRRGTSMGAQDLVILALVAMLLMVVRARIAAPVIPRAELLLCAIVLLALLLANFFVPSIPAAFAIEVVIGLVCTFGFGMRWKKKGYIPAEVARY